MMNFNFRLKIYIGVAIFLIISFFFKDSQPVKELPEIGNIPQFEFTNSDGNIVTLDNLKGKVWVADFIFTTCTMACPMMTGKIGRAHV